MEASANSSAENGSDIDARTYTVFKQCLALDDSVAKTDLRYQETANWDSIGHMTIIAGLEDEFDCMLDTDDILDMSSFKKAVEIMGKYI